MRAHAGLLAALRRPSVVGAWATMALAADGDTVACAAATALLWHVHAVLTLGLPGSATRAARAGEGVGRAWLLALAGDTGPPVSWLHALLRYHAIGAPADAAAGDARARWLLAMRAPTSGSAPVAHVA